MRVFVAGATGVIGRRLLPMLDAAGHDVSAITRSPQRAEQLRAAGVDARVADALDRDALHAAVDAAAPDVVIHQLTSLPARLDPRQIERDLAANDRLRREGTPLLVDAAAEAGARLVIAQSVAFAYQPGPPGTLHVERDQLALKPPKSFQRTIDALVDLERSVVEACGVVLRYGYFYGPGSAISRDGSFAQELHARRLPIIGGGRGVWSFIHVDDAASATVAALGCSGPAVLNIVDDDPAPVSQWLPALASAIGAPPPRRIPTVLARIAAGSFAVQQMTRSQGASNDRAKQRLDWTPAYPSWREGFGSGL